MVENDRRVENEPIDLKNSVTTHFHRFFTDIGTFLPIKQKNLQKILKLFVCYVEIALEFVSSVK